MRKLFLSAALISALTFSGAAAQAETVKATVNGLVCDFCAQGIQKVFGEHDEVKSVDVNMSERLVTIQFKEKKSMDDGTIKKLIEGNGFTVVGMKRSES